MYWRNCLPPTTQQTVPKVTLLPACFLNLGQRKGANLQSNLLCHKFKVWYDVKISIIKKNLNQTWKSINKMGNQH